MKQYDAIIWPEDPIQPGERITIIANSVDEARAKIEEQYGKGRVYTVKNKEEASRPR
jgi:hypothetical protein